MKGKRYWCFPDAELPPMGSDQDIYGHESIIILNPNECESKVIITLYFTDRPPVLKQAIVVESKRVMNIRITERNGFLGYPVVEGEQYSISIESDVPVIAQYGRLDVRQSNMAFYTTNGYQE